MTKPRRGVRPPVIDAALARELEQYKGLWVAIHQGHVVASGGSAVEARQRARAHSVTDPILFRVPAYRPGVSYYLVHRAFPHAVV
jgi:hypothetical protein